MAKFYVSSGTLRVVIQAEDARRAALWAVHRVMQQILPIFDDDEFTAHEKQRLAMHRGFQMLENEICVNQRGFGEEGCLLDTFDIVAEWSKLMIALTRMEAAIEGEDRQPPMNMECFAASA